MKKLTVLSSAPAQQEQAQPTQGSTETTAAVQRGSTYWRSLEQKVKTYDELADTWREFPKDAEHLEVRGGVSRRRFFGILGSGAALAGIAGTTGCVRKPKEEILPFAKRPEDMIPGKPMFYATAWNIGGTVEGLVVESQDGRPTKIEGNPKHPGSLGATSVYAQAAILDIYDPDRSRVPRQGQDSIDFATARTQFETLVSAAAAKGGQGLALVIPYISSPTERDLLKQFKQRFPQARVFVDDLTAPWNAMAGAEMVGGKGARARRNLDGAKVVFAVDSDFLATKDLDGTRLAREWSKGRRVFGSNDAEKMSRFYAVEPHFTVTGQMADHRLRVKASQCGDVLIALAKALGKGGFPTFKPPQGVDFAGLTGGELDEATQKFVDALARDMAKADRGEDGKPTEAAQPAAIIVGERQPAWVHALAGIIESSLGGSDQRRPTQTLFWTLDSFAPEAEGLEAFAEALGSLDTIVCLQTNPVYDAPAALGIGGSLEGKTLVHIGHYRDETFAVSKLHLPMSHFLEAWGDLEASDGTVSIQQPLIDPLHGTYSRLELLGWLATGELTDGFSLVRGYWSRTLGVQFSDRLWRTWLHDGVVTGAPREPVFPALSRWGEAMTEIGQQRAATEGAFEVNFHLDPKLLDGRFSNNAWMQELPHPMTKLVWDNAALVSFATAQELGVKNGDLVDITVGGKTAQLPIWIAPGQADKTVSIELGYGRTWGRVGKGVGVDVNAIRPSSTTWFAGGSVTVAGGNYGLVSTQDYGTMKPPSNMGIDFPERPIALETSVKEFTDDPNFVERVNLMEPSRLHHLWDPPELTGKQQWGMSVDLNTCTGCNACVVACQAENNIPVVGKEQCGMGREMHWMRLDRYYRGDENSPTAIVQPMYCQHCESAPCETVCPVAATVHSPEGLNDMAYNRCIGTRYCSNNCPYKVRRYNFFNYNLDLRTSEFWTDEPDGAWLKQMQKNPDVTVRFRGVMEKCTYCVQRINGAKIEAHVAGKDLVEDGGILTACQQVCPTGALVFGDIYDPDSKVSKAKRSPRDYSVLRDLNTHPRTTYLARIRNPNPDLV